MCFSWLSVPQSHPSSRIQPFRSQAPGPGPENPHPVPQVPPPVRVDISIASSVGLPLPFGKERETGWSLRASLEGWEGDGLNWVLGREHGGMERFPGVLPQGDSPVTVVPDSVLRAFPESSLGSLTTAHEVGSILLSSFC